MTEPAVADVLLLLAAVAIGAAAGGSLAWRVARKRLHRLERKLDSTEHARAQTNVLLLMARRQTEAAQKELAEARLGGLLPARSAAGRAAQVPQIPHSTVTITRSQTVTKPISDEWTREKLVAAFADTMPADEHGMPILTTEVTRPAPLDEA